jgi:hypothetical protein
MSGTAPVSRTTQPLISSACSSMSRPALRSTAARSSNVAAAQSRCAAAAAAHARSTSDASATPVRPNSAPVAGSMIAVSPPWAATQPPL